MAINSSDHLLLNQTGVTFKITASQLATFVINEIGGGGGGINLIDLDDTPSDAPDPGQIIIGDNSGDFEYTTLLDEIKTGSARHKLEDHTDVNGGPTLGDYTGMFLLGQSATELSYAKFEDKVQAIVDATDNRIDFIGQLDDVNQTYLGATDPSLTSPSVGDVLLWSAPGEYVPTLLTGAGGLIDLEINGGATGPGNITINGEQVSKATEVDAAADAATKAAALGVVAIKKGGGVTIDADGIIDVSVPGGLVAKGNFNFSSDTGGGDTPGGTPGADADEAGQMWVAIDTGSAGGYKQSTAGWSDPTGNGLFLTNGSIVVATGVDSTGIAGTGAWVTMGVLDFVPATANLESVTTAGKTTTKGLEATGAAIISTETGNFVSTSGDFNTTSGDFISGSGKGASTGGTLSVANIDFDRFDLLP